MKLGVHGQHQLVWLHWLITVMFRVILSIQIDKIVGMIAMLDYLQQIIQIYAELGLIHLFKLALDQTAR